METNDKCEGCTQRAADVFATKGLNGQEQHVADIKLYAAILWDKIDSISVPPGLQCDAMRLVALAKTNLEQSVMWAVKALSRNH